MTSRAVLAVLAVASVTALGGCGGGGDDKLSKSEFVAKADRICKTYVDRGRKIPAPTGPDDLARYVKEAEPVSREQLDKLRDLEDQAPDELAADYGKALDALDRQLDLFAQLATAGGDQTKIAKISTEGGDLTEQTNKLARKLGFKECGKG